MERNGAAAEKTISNKALAENNLELNRKTGP